MVDYINPGDNGKVAREKINAMLEEVQANIPSIGQNGNWYIGGIDTGIPATGPRGPQGKRGAEGQPGHTPVKGVDYFTQADIESLNIPEKVSDLTNDKNFSSMEEVTENEWENIEDRMTNNVNYFIYE